MGFSIPKTELIHWRTSRDRDPPSTAPIHLDGSFFRPKNELRWLGLWFTPSLATTPHFTKRLAKAQAAFVAIKRLSPPGMGLPPYLCHRMAASLLFSILGYVGDIFHPTVHMLRNLAVFWHKVQRWCIVFVTGRGGADFHSQGPAVKRGRGGGYFSGNPRPAPARGPPVLIPWTGPHLLPPIFNGDPSGVWVGRGPERGQGQGMPKKTPRPRPLSGAGRGKGPGARIFRGPVRPVTNSNGVRTASPAPRPISW